MGYKLKRILIYPDGVTEKQVYPAGWKPGSNTLLYLPLDGNTNNYGSSYSMTNNGNAITFSSIGNIQVGYFNQGCLYTDVLNASELTGSLTYNIWVKTVTFNVHYIISSGVQENGKSRVLQTYNNNVYRASFWYADLDTPSNTLVLNTWQNVVLTFDGTTKARAIYVNGNKIVNDTASASVFTSTKLVVGGNNSASGFVEDTYLSNVIIENKARTAQEIQDYYNQTKSNYGL